MRSNRFRALCIAVTANLITASQAFAADSVERVGNAGASGIWLLANFSYAGMRAQGSRRSGWRFLTFIFGFPGTCLTWLVVDENSEQAYGVDLPRKVPPAAAKETSPAKDPVVL